jgi:hypothetical protein
VLKTQRHFRSKHQGNCFDGVNIGDYGKGEFGNKNTNIRFGIGSRIR